MNRGEIWWAPLPVPKGSGPGFRRPVLIVSADSFNRSRLATVRLAEALQRVELGGGDALVVLARLRHVDEAPLLDEVRKTIGHPRVGRLAVASELVVGMGARAAPS